MASLKEKAARAALDEETGPFNALGYFGSDEERILDIPIDQILTDPTQPREDLGDIESLKHSIQEHGLLQPILVSPAKNKTYQIIAGERRFTAAKSLGRSTIKALVRTIEDHQRLEIQLVENIQRKDLNALEEAQSYKRLIAEFGMTQEQLARRLGKTQAAINQSLRILELPKSVKEDYKTSYNPASPVTKSVLLEIVKQPSEEKQLSMWTQAKQGELTVKKAREEQRPKLRKSTAQERTAQVTFHYPIRTQRATIMLAFEQPSATPDEVIDALREALEAEEAKRDPSTATARLPHASV